MQQHDVTGIIARIAALPRISQRSIRIAASSKWIIQAFRFDRRSCGDGRRLRRFIAPASSLDESGERVPRAHIGTSALAPGRRT